MKVCKKCKKSIANNAKVCKYCGHVVSKNANKIVIKNSSKNNEISISKRNENNKNSIDRQQELKKKKQEKYNQAQRNQALLKNEARKKKQDKKKSDLEKESKSFIENTKSISKKTLKKPIENNSKIKTNSKLKNNQKQEKKKDLNNKRVENKDKSKKVKEKDSKIKEDKKISEQEKEKKNIDKQEKDNEIKIDKKIDNINDELENNKKIDNTKSIKHQKLHDTISKMFNEDEKSKLEMQEIEEVLKKEREEEKEKLHSGKLINKIFNKYTFITLILLILGITIFVCGTMLFKENSSFNIGDTYGKTFNLNQRIKYDDIVYSITNVEEIEGTEYRQPKDGNRFIMVTIEMQNSGKDKVKYSYRNWRMNNSSGNSVARIFTPSNADTALYSGYLVVGAKKSGTLVFEQPKDDNNLYLEFYRLISSKDDDGNFHEDIDEDTGIIFKVDLDLA